MSTVGIYIITSPTNKIYVGQSWNIEKRKINYEGVHCKNQYKLYHSLKKHGWEAHKFEIELELRDDISQESLDTWEQYFMDKYRGAGYELLNLRGSGSRGRQSEETKKKQRLSKLGSKNPRFGKPKHHDEKTIQILREKKLGRLNPMFGRIGSKHHNSKPVLQFTREGKFIKEWECATSAQRELGINQSRISSVCLGKHNHRLYLEIQRMTINFNPFQEQQIPLDHMRQLVSHYIFTRTGQQINIVINMAKENDELLLLHKAYQMVCDQN